MSKNDVDSILKVAKIHEQRLLEALKLVENLFPFDENKILNLTQTQFLALESLTTRYARLQDLMGSKLFDLCLEKLGESIDGLSMIDKANKLEKSSIIADAHVWTEMRRMRNHITHEYPDQPEITADLLNRMHGFINPMLEIYHNMLASITQA